MQIGKEAVVETDLTFLKLLKLTGMVTVTIYFSIAGRKILTDLDKRLKGTNNKDVPCPGHCFPMALIARKTNSSVLDQVTQNFSEDADQ